ncbi:MAG TPA: hypothetical protein ENI23_11660 [bacterium]|nr:hypothetical protein [bacterium]
MKFKKGELVRIRNGWANFRDIYFMGDKFHETGYEYYVVYQHKTNKGFLVMEKQIQRIPKAEQDLLKLSL